MGRYSSKDTNSSNQFHRKNKQRVPKSCLLDVVSIDTYRPICPFQTLKDKQVKTSRGRYESEKFQSLQNIVHCLEEQIRNGDAAARLDLQDLIPVAVVLPYFPQALQFWKKRGRKIIFSIESFPDIFVPLMQSMLFNITVSDELVSFIRACVPFSQNARRSNNNQTEKRHENDVSVLLRCCLPTLLSLFQQAGVKDVNFFARVSIYHFFEELLTKNSAEQLQVFYRLKPLLRICLMEYIHHYILFVTKIPYNLKTDLNALYGNTFNMGQSLRIELNEKFDHITQNSTESTGESISCDKTMDLLLTTIRTCEIMYERTLRTSKSIIINTKHLQHKKRDVYRSKHKQSKKKLALDQEVYVENIPYSPLFYSFEKICSARGIDQNHIGRLWSMHESVKIHELTSDFLCLQLKAINKMGYMSRKDIEACSKLVLCLSCLQENLYTTFRCDLRTKQYTCTRCEQSKSCVEVSMLGRIVWVRNIPLIFSPCCCRIMVYSGLSSPTPLDADSCCVGIPWGKHCMSSSFSSIMTSMNFMHFLVQKSTFGEGQAPNIANNHYCHQRIRGNQSTHLELSTTIKTCSLCKSVGNMERYRLLDIFSGKMITVQACYRHVLPKKWDVKDVFTLQNYLDILQFSSRLG